MKIPESILPCFRRHIGPMVEAHRLVEVYSTLTRMPGKYRISGERAMLFLGDLRERLSLITLDGEEYFRALRDAASLGVVGGAIYDAMLAHCALKAQAETIYSWNAGHYAQCGQDIALLLGIVPQRLTPNSLRRVRPQGRTLQKKPRG
jgi:predicted nucleic acid-binding protein